MTGSAIRQAVVPDKSQRGSRVAAAQLTTQRLIADLKSEGLQCSPRGSQMPTAHVAASGAEASFPPAGSESVESALRDECGLPQRRVGSAQARATSDSPVQSAASLDLAWRVVFAAEQRKAQLVENARPLAFRSRRPAEKAQVDSPDRPPGAHGSRAILPTSGGGGELQVSPIPARQQIRTGRATGSGSCPTRVVELPNTHLLPATGSGSCPTQAVSLDADGPDREDLQRLAQEVRGGPVLSSSAKDTISAASRRRGQQSGANAFIAVSGQALSRQRPPTSNGWPSEGPPENEARVLIDAACEHLASAVADGARASEELTEEQQQALRVAGATQHDTDAVSASARWGEDATPTCSLLQNAEDDPRNEDPGSPPAKTVEDDRNSSELWSQSAAGVGEGMRPAPSSADAIHTNGAVRRVLLAPTTAGSEKNSGACAAAATVTAAARATRRATIASAHRSNGNMGANGTASSSAAQASVPEPLSPLRPGASIRRSRSMPASRKSADDPCSKPKASRASFARRPGPAGYSSMPKSTAAAAAGAGAVAAKKRAKASRKLMLPFAYAEDDPRVGHVECADGRIVPEYLP